MDLDITIINGRHWKSQKDDKVYNTLDIVLLSKENFIENEKFLGYSVVTCWLKENILNDIKILEPCKAHFDTKMVGLKSTLKLVSLTFKDGKTINLS